jgi:hypothetical protein
MHGVQLKDLPGSIGHCFLSSQQQLDSYGRVFYPMGERFA